MGEGNSGGVTNSSLDEAEDAQSRNGVILVSPENASLSGGILSCCKGDYQVGGGSGVRKRSGARRFGGDHLDASETSRRSKV